jgi:hypothetical protein
VSIQQQLSDGNVLLIDSSTHHNTENEAQVILQGQVVDNVGNTLHREFPNVLVLMVKKVSIHQSEELLYIGHDLVIVCLHEN